MESVLIPTSCFNAVSALKRGMPVTRFSWSRILKAFGRTEMCIVKMTSNLE